MKTIYRKTTVVVAIFATIFLLTCVSVEARTFKPSVGYTADSGTTRPITTVSRVRGLPISVRYTMPDTYFVGVPTPVTATFSYLGREKGLFGSYKKGKRYRYGKLYGKRKFKIFDLKFSTKQTTGLDLVDASESGTLGLPQDSGHKPVLVRANKSRTVTFWVTYKKCFAWPDMSLPGPQWNIPRSYYLNQMFGFTTPPQGSPCVWVPEMTISWKGKISRGGFSTKQNGSFVLKRIPLIPTESTAVTVVDPQPTPSTGPTGSTDPTGPTGPTG